jgi:glycosyltransferase involved in cell wall biosynthesis
MVEHDMRVVLDVSAVPTQPVGAGIYTLELARGLSDSAMIDLHLLSRRNDERWEQLCPNATVHKLTPDSRPLRIAWERTRGARFAADVQCDLWHGPHYTLPRGLRCATVVTIHDLTFFDNPETHERVKVQFFRRAITTNARRATQVVCVSQTTADRLDALVAGHAPTIVAHHGVDHDRFFVNREPRQDALDQALLAERGIHGDFITFVGTIQPRKALPTLITAFAALKANFPQLRLVIAGGDGWGTTELLDAIRTHGVATSVVRPGYVDDATVAALYRQAKVVAYPSLAEGFGLPALEAMACGAALVTTRGTAMDEFLDDGAITAPPGDADALTAALRVALTDETQRRLRARGPQIAAAFTWSACVGTHLGAYGAAITRHSNPSRLSH